MLDAILRRGRTLESAAQGAGGLKREDQGLAVAIAGEVLRRMPDLDRLIDSATRQRIAEDSKARMVLRIALAQRIGLADTQQTEPILDECDKLGRMLRALIRVIQEKSRAEE